MATFVAALLLFLSLSPLAPLALADPGQTPAHSLDEQGSAWEGRGTGFVPPPDEARQEYYGRGVAPMANAYLPPSIDLSQDPWFPAVGHQGSQGSCAAWALAYYCYGYQEARDNGWTDAKTNPEHQISPAWGYNRVSGGQDKGTWMEAVADALCDWGAATMATMPYDESDFWSWGSEEAFREAPLHRPQETVSLGYQGDATIEEVKALIVSGIPVTFAMTSSNINPFRDNYVLSSREYAVGAADHAQTLVGYDDSIVEDGEQGAFKVVNSWGTGFGDNGFYWLTYEAIKEIGASGKLYLTYVVDRQDYEPTALMVWHFDGPLYQSSQITVRTEGGEITPRYNTGANAAKVRMPSFMLLDVTDEYVGPGQMFTFSISVACTISSLRMEYYDMYVPGRPSTVSPISSDVPSSRTASVQAPAYEALPLHTALDLATSRVTTGGTSAWTAVRFDPSVGGAVAQSGDIASGTSWVKAIVSGPGTLEFNWAIDAMGYDDTLSVHLDGVKVASIDGTSGWRSKSVDVPAGEHEICWSYERRGAGGGSGMVDAVTWAIDELRIDGDHELLGMSERMGWPGSGSEDSPLMISNMTMPMGGLYIGNTTLHLIISNCILSGADGAAAHLYNVSNVRFTGSTFADNGIGLLLEGSSAMVDGNRFIGNGIGLDIDGSGSVSENLFRDNEGFAVIARSSGWTVHLNAFVGNNGVGEGDDVRAQAMDLGGSAWSWEGHGNHWSDWTTDQDGDWFSDTPYDVGHSADQHPFSTPSSVPRAFTAEVVGGVTHLSWDVPEFAMAELIGYEVERTGPDGVTSNILAAEVRAMEDAVSETASYSYRIRALTALGAGDWSSPFEVYVPDVTPPSIGIVSPADGKWTASAAVRWAGSDDGAGIDRYEISLDGGAFEDMGLSVARTFTGLAEGRHTVTVVAYDGAGNRAESSVSFRLDLTKPSITIASPTPGVMGSSHVDISIRASDQGSGLSTVTVQLDGATIGEAVKGSMDLSVELADGEHTLTVIARDAVGNRASSKVTFTVAATAPVIEILGPQGGTASSSSLNVSCSFAGPRETWAQVRVDGGEWHNISSALCHTFDGLEDGVHVIEAMAWDASGLMDVRSVSVEIDTTPPAATIERANGTIRITFSEEVDRNSTTCLLGVDHDVIWDHGVMVIVPSAPLAAGNHSLAVHAVDRAGNSIDMSFKITIDAVADSPRGTGTLLVYAAIAVVIIVAAALLVRRK